MVSSDIIRSIKDQVDIVVAADMYGLQLNRNGKACCPFHDERTPSFAVSSVRKAFKCFGCGRNGDVIALVMWLKHLSFVEAVAELNQTFTLGLDVARPPPIEDLFRVRAGRNMNAAFRAWERAEFQRIVMVRQCLYHWTMDHAPVTPEDGIDPRYITAVTLLNRVDDRLDLLRDDPLQYFTIYAKGQSNAQLHP